MMDAGAVQADAKADPLRLRACPGCDYSLEALAEVGVCPECGRKYDRQYVVLSGVGRGQHWAAGGGLVRGLLLSMAGLAGFAVMAAMAGRQSPALVGMAVGAAISVLAQLYVRLFSAREPRMQVWMSAEGVGQVLSTPESRRAQWVGEHATRWGMAAAVAVIGVSDPRVGVFKWVGGVWMAVEAIVAWRRWRAGWPGPGEVVGDSAGEAPRIWPWKAVDAMEVRVVTGGKVRVRCDVIRRWGGLVVSNNGTDVEIEGDEALAEALRGEMGEWWRAAVGPEELARRAKAEQRARDRVW